MPKFPENFFVERIHCGHPDRGWLERRRQGRVHLDTLVHDGTGRIAHSENADTSIDFYHRWKEDVA